MKTMTPLMATLIRKSSGKPRANRRKDKERLTLPKVLLVCLALLSLLVQSVPVSSLTKQDYKAMGLLPYKAKPYFTLGKLDKLGRPTWAHIQFHDFIKATAAKDYKDPKKSITGKTGHRTDYLPGYLGNEDYYLIPPEEDKGFMDKVWAPDALLYTLWTDASANKARNYGLFTSYAYWGYPKDRSDLSRLSGGMDLKFLHDYERALDAWVSYDFRDWGEDRGYMVDYKIELLYEGDELVPRQIKLRYVGLTKEGDLQKIDLPGDEDFDEHGIATVIIDNIAPNVTIDYKTGEVTGGNRYVKAEEPESAPYEEEEEEENAVYVDRETGYYYYSEDIDDPDDYQYMTEREAILEGYSWDALGR